MTIPDLIRYVTTDEYANDQIYLRLTGRADNYVLCVGTKHNHKFHYNFQHYSSRIKAIKEIKRLASIYIVTEKRGRAAIGAKHKTYIYKQIIKI